MRRSYLGIEIDDSRNEYLTPLAIKTLQERYLTEEETSPQEAFARASVAYADDLEHAQRIYDYASNLWFMFATPILSNGGTDKGLPISCFVGDTLVLTYEKGSKFIKDIEVGDLVKTHKGRYRKVLATKKSISKEIFTVTVDYGSFGQKLRVTGNHLLMTPKGWKRVDELDINKDLLAWSPLGYDLKNQGMSYRKISSINLEMTKEVEVYDIQVEEDESFIANGVVAHNCFLSAVGDSRKGLSDHYDENIWLASNGGGIGGYWGDIRSDGQSTTSGSKSSGSIPFLHVVDSQMMAFNQGTCYLPGHEVLTSKGWVKFEDLEHFENLHIIQVCESGYTKAVKPIEYVEYEIEDEYVEFRHKGRSIVKVTKNHAMVVMSGNTIESDPKIKKIPAIDVQYNKENFFPLSTGEIFEREIFYRETLGDHREVGFLSTEEELKIIRSMVRNGYGLSYRDERLVVSNSGLIPGNEIEKILHPKSKQTVRCVEVPSGMLLVRYDGFVSVCGNTRRGSYAAYQNISHPEIEEFIGMRKPTGGDIHRKCMNLHHGVNITDDFMQIIERCMEDPNENDDWDLIDPHSGRVTDTVSAKDLWAKVLETRVATGEPYIHFIDRSNEFLPEAQKKLGLRVNQSNLCSEIIEATDSLRTAVCCLSSPNLAKWDDWKENSLFIRDLVRFLDNVIEFFVWSVFDRDKEGELEDLNLTYDVRVKKTKGNFDSAEIKRFDDWLREVCIPGQEGLRKAAFSAYRERSLGLGAMGFHSLLQSKNIPFESPMAIGLNLQIFKFIKNEALKETKNLAQLRGEAPDLIGTGRRNAHLLAIAPNASSSNICGGTSPSGEPFAAIAFTSKTLSGSFFQKNSYFQRLLESKGISENEIKKIWKSIISNNGSCQHLEILDDWEKQVFKTALEIDQNWIIEHASMRQKFICQSQSLNVFFRPDEEIRYLHNVHFSAWKKGIKTLYYCRSSAIRRAENVETKVERNYISDQECLSCEG